MVEKINNGIRLYSLIAGLLYIVLGTLQALLGFGLDLGLGEILLLPEDGIGGLALLIIGIVFLFGTTRTSRDPNEGVSFAFVGAALSLFFAVIYFLILLADIFEARVLVSEDWEGWTLLDSIRPGLYLGLLSLIGYFVLKKKKRFSRKSNA